MLLYGKWDECLYATQANAVNASSFASRVEKFIASGVELTDPDIELLWRAPVVTSPKERGLFDKQFNFNPFTFKLNELHDYMQKPTRLWLKSSGADEESSGEVSLGPLPPTDCRLRPDLRLYESGKIDEASAEKHRLEEKQREKAKRAEAGEAKEVAPMWFVANQTDDNDDEHSSPSTRGVDKVVQERNQLYKQEWLFKNVYWNREFSKCPDIF